MTLRKRNKKSVCEISRARCQDPAGLVVKAAERAKDAHVAEARLLGYGIV
ncbi:MAG: hypothetical protein ACRDKB_12335 [Actinomycetota bacterium]